MISVIIPLYNKEQSIQRALLSAMQQSLPPDEILVVDDGSTDRSVANVRAIAGSTTRIIAQSNQGVSAARNRGIAEAKGDFLAFLDADDEWHRDFLSTMAHLFHRYPQCGIAAARYNKVSIEGTKTQNILRPEPTDEEECLLQHYFEVAAHSDPPINSSSMMVRKEAIHAIGGFPIGIGQGEDLLTWARLAVNNSIAYYLQPLSNFYTGSKSTMEVPKRMPPAHDVVGRELATLQQKHPDIPGMRQYVAHWHKMRASIFLRLHGCAAQCRQEIALARQWNPACPHLTLYGLLLALPYDLRMNILHKHRI